MIDEPANENRYLEYGCLDPDRHYVSDYLKKAVAHFRDCKIHPDTICEGLNEEIVDLLVGDPAEDTLDEGELWSNLQLLWLVEWRVEPLIRQHIEALKRLAEKLQAERNRKAGQAASQPSNSQPGSES